MKMKMKRYFPLALVVAGLLLGGAWLLGGGFKTAAAGPPHCATVSNPTKEVPFDKAFWTYLTNEKTSYKNWKYWPGKEGFYPGQSPHGAFLKAYVNKQAASNVKNLPYQSVIVKENYGKDKKTLMAVTIMYRHKGYDPTHNDWYWIKYRPDGTVDRKGDMKLMGKVKGCISCHSGAEGDDYVFLNDEG